MARVEGMSDRQSLAAFKRRSTPMGLLVAGGVTLLVVGATTFMFFSYQDVQVEEQLVNATGNYPQGSPDMLSALRATWPQLKSRDQKLRVVQNLYHFQDPEAGPLYIEALNDGGGVRRFAALGLARLGKPGTEGAVSALESALPKTDPRIDRTAVTWALAVLGGNAPDAVLEDFAAGRYQEDDEIKILFDPSVIARALGPERLKSSALLTHEQESVRLLTAQSLAELGGSEVVDALNALLQNELSQPAAKQSLSVIEAAAAGLGRTGDPSAVTLLAKVTSLHPTLRTMIYRQLQRTAGGPQLATLLGSAPDPEQRRALVKLLAETHDARVSDTLVALLEDADTEVRQAAALGLAEFGDDRALEALVRLVSSDDSTQVHAGLEAIRKVASPRAAALLLSVLPARCPADPEPDSPRLCFHRAAFIGALASSGGTKASDRIVAELNTPDNMAAALALARLDHAPTFQRMLTQAKRPGGTNMHANTEGDRNLAQEDLLLSRKAAIVSLGHFGHAEAAEVLFPIVQDAANDDFELRLLAGRSLGLIGSEGILMKVLGEVRSVTHADDTRVYFAEALWQRPTANLREPLLALLQETAPPAAKRAAGMALGLLLTDDDEARLIPLLEREDARVGAAIALTLGGSTNTAALLLNWIEKDRNLAEDLEEAITGNAVTAFDVLTVDMFERQLWRQLAMAKALNQGVEQARFPYAWTQALHLLSTGSEGLGRVGQAEARARLFDQLRGTDPTHRALAASVLLGAKEYGLLVSARDENGPGATEARAALLGH